MATGNNQTNSSNQTQDVKFVFQEWMTLLANFKSHVDDTLEVIRQDKREIQQIKKEIYNRINKGHYMYDDNRIVIAAPEIIIGNVDKNGQLKPGDGSKVIIRSNNISLEGVGMAGEVQTKATTIRQVAMDPGDDGLEEVVHQDARVLTQARTIVIDSNDSCNGIYTRSPGGEILRSGVTIHADHNLTVDSSVCLTDNTKTKKTKLSADINQLNLDISNLEGQLADHIQKMQDTLKQDKGLRLSNELTSVNLISLDLLHLLLTNASTALFNTINDYVDNVSKLAEKKRQLKALNEITGQTQPTGAKLVLNAENISLSNRDGDSNVLTNEDAKISIKSKNVQLSGTGDDGVTLPESVVDIWSNNVNVFTNGVEIESESAQKYPAKGSVNINSGCIKLMAYDLEGNQDAPMQPTELANEGIVQILSKNIDLKGIDKDGKSVGHTTVVGKEVAISSCDFNPETMEMKNLSPEGKVVIRGERIRVGSRTEGTKTVKMAGKGVYMLGEEQVYLHTRNDKHTLNLNQDNFYVRTFGKYLFKKNKSKGLAITDSEINIKAPLIVDDSVEVKSLTAKEHAKVPNGEFGKPSAKSPSNVPEVQEAEDKKNEEKVTEIERNFNTIVKAAKDFLFPTKRR